MTPPVQDILTTQRDPDGSVILSWSPPTNGVPPDATALVEVKDGSDTFVEVGRPGILAGQFLYPNTTTNGIRRLEFEIRTASKIWGSSSSRAASAGPVPPPAVARKIQPRDGFLPVHDAGITNATHLVFRFRSAGSSPSEQDGGPWRMAANPVAEAFGAHAAYRLDAVNAGGRTPVTGWIDIPPFRFTNSLGQVFAPIPGVSNVLGCIWPTRVQDYEEYAKSSPLVDGSWKGRVFTDAPTVSTAPGPTYPVVNTTWTNAVDFCQWLTQLEREGKRIPLTAEYRLLKDAEWSWAAGIGEKEAADGANRTLSQKHLKITAGSHPFAYVWGPNWPPPPRAGNFADTSAKEKFTTLTVIPDYDDGFPATSPVDAFPANPHGFHDLVGNVWQWCDDAIDGTPGSRVLRGGSWLNVDPTRLLSSFRDDFGAGFRDGLIGFRVALVGVAVR